MENKTLQNLREEYEAESLSESSVFKNPLEQFIKWFEEAVNAGLLEANAMTLAAANVNFKPSARMVLLKGIVQRSPLGEDDGFIFFTNYSSRKGKELLWNPYAALLFFWNELHRQVRIDGRVVRLSAEASDQYFHSRPVSSQLGAFISPQSRVIESRSWLEEKLKEAEHDFSGKTVPRPENWGGYKVIPNLIEFWQGRPNRLHDRLQYTLTEKDSWKIERLAP